MLECISGWFEAVRGAPQGHRWLSQDLDWVGRNGKYILDAILQQDGLMNRGKCDGVHFWFFWGPEFLAMTLDEKRI